MVCWLFPFTLSSFVCSLNGRLNSVPAHFPPLYLWHRSRQNGSLRLSLVETSTIASASLKRGQGRSPLLRCDDRNSSEKKLNFKFQNGGHATSSSSAKELTYLRKRSFELEFSISCDLVSASSWSSLFRCPQSPSGSSLVNQLAWRLSLQRATYLTYRREALRGPSPLKKRPQHSPCGTWVSSCSRRRQAPSHLHQHMPKGACG